MTKKKLTIKEFAEILGVSTATVSRAFSSKGRISDKTRQSIIAKAEELGYRANIHARNLGGSNSSTIAMYYPELSSEEPDYFISEIIMGINSILSKNGKNLQINPLMKISERFDQTGCFVCYNTISDEKGKEAQAPTILPGTFVVNPLSWNTNTAFAPESENIEAVFFKHEDPENPARYPNFAAAQKKGNALVITQISHPEELPATSVTFPEGVYHMYDYAIFYGNLRKNVADRIKAFQNR